jgi:hypothetical protein
MSHFMKTLLGEDWPDIKIKKGQIIKITILGDQIKFKFL